jgi:hypothetical protein
VSVHFQSPTSKAGLLRRDIIAPQLSFIKPLMLRHDDAYDRGMTHVAETMCPRAQRCPQSWSCHTPPFAWGTCCKSPSHVTAFQ